MNENKLRRGELTIKAAVILKLIGNALIALWTALSYSDMTDNLYRISRGGGQLPMIVGGIFADTLLTVLWLKNKSFHTIHVWLYILLYGLAFIGLLVDLMNLYGANALGAVVTAPILWAAGLIPFIVCGAGRRSRTKAMQGDDYGER